MDDKPAPRGVAACMYIILLALYVVEEILITYFLNHEQAYVRDSHCVEEEEDRV